MVLAWRGEEQRRTSLLSSMAWNPRRRLVWRLSFCFVCCACNWPLAVWTLCRLQLSQWMTYSLMEPLQAAGFTIRDLGAMTGLPEYRNGGLLVDLGLLVPKHASVIIDSHAPDSQVGVPAPGVGFAWAACW